MNEENCTKQLPAKTPQKTCKNLSKEQKRDLSTGPGPEPSTSVSAFRKQNTIERVVCERDAVIRAAGREKEPARGPT